VSGEGADPVLFLRFNIEGYALAGSRTSEREYSLHLVKMLIIIDDPFN
jgi:hypothetical protein